MRFLKAFVCRMTIVAIALLCFISLAQVFKINNVDLHFGKVALRSESSVANTHLDMADDNAYERFVREGSEPLQKTYSHNSLEKQQRKKQTNILRFKRVVKQFANASGPRIVSYKVRDGFRKVWGASVDLRKCEYNDCSFRFIPEDSTSFDHGNVSLDAEAVIMQGNWLPRKPPLRRDAGQVFVFFDMECPWYIHLPHYRKQPWASIFNWTMTFRLDSDIPNPYALPVLKNESSRELNYSEIFRNKTKDVLWFVSHCQTSSKRELYVKELGKYINVDIYGGCTERKKACLTQKREQCLSEAIQPYKFYLSFENNMCKDYITEKYYNLLPLNIVPIVRGGGNYTRIVPKGTYINTADFSSPRELAVYLNMVGNSQTEYTRFLKEKRKYEVVKHSYQRSFCSLCKKLHKLRENVKAYEDMAAWWAKDVCHTPRDLGVLNRRPGENELSGWLNGNPS